MITNKINKTGTDEVVRCVMLAKIRHKIRYKKCLMKNAIIRQLVIILSAAMIVVSLSGCSINTKDADKDKYKIVCTIFPEYDWVMNLINNNEDYDVTLLIDNGTDLHSYQASAKDIMTIENADMFIYVGGESDNWVKDVLKEHPNPKRIDLNLMEVLGDKVYCEEIIEGMQSDFGADDSKNTADSATEETDEGESETEYDEHVWLSLRNAQIICSKISEELKSLDKEDSNVTEYDKALADYINKLSELDKKYSETVAEGKTDTLLFGDRFPFRYMVEDYGLNYYAAFPGCSAETEASFETVVFLAGVVDDDGISKICVTETSDQSIAKTIIENSKAKNADIVVFDSMQSVTSKDIESGATYLSYMESNLEALKKVVS